MMFLLTILAMLIFATSPGFLALLWAAFGIMLAGILTLAVYTVCLASEARRRIGSA